MLRRLTIAFACFTCAGSAQTGPAGVRASGENVLWLKADAGSSSTTHNTAISFWNDQSGNSINVTQTVSAQQPSFSANVMNGMPAIRFDNVSGANVNDKLIGPDSPLLDNTQGYTFFMVSRPEVFGDARVIVSKRTGVAINQSFMHFFYNSNRFYTDIQTNNNRYNTSFTFTVNNGYSICQQFDGTLAMASRCRTYVNSNLDITASETNTLVPDNASPLVIGSTDETDGRPFGGYIAEVIMYRVALPQAERIIVDNYISAKYNITMSMDDKYAGDDAGNGNYDFEVAGVGQESNGSTTSFSPSVSGGIGVTITSGLDNGDYLLAGHTSAANADNTSDVGGMTGISNARWERVWYFDITNTSTALGGNVTFDLSDGGMGTASPAFPANYVLLFRSGQSGNWTELETASSLSGDRILFSGITLSNDGYYTIGTKNFSLSTLPVSLAGFNAKSEGSVVSATWKSLIETDLVRYTVQRSRDGLAYTTVTDVLPAYPGYNYAAVDHAPYSGISYYRLVIHEKNRTWYSSPVWVLNENTGIELFPNPNNGRLTIRVPQGLTVSELVLCAADGTFRLLRHDVRKEGITADLTSFADGVYMLLIRHNEGTFSERIVLRH